MRRTIVLRGAFKAAACAALVALAIAFPAGHTSSSSAAVREFRLGIATTLELLDREPGTAGRSFARAAGWQHELTKRERTAAGLPGLAARSTGAQIAGWSGFLLPSAAAFAHGVNPHSGHCPRAPPGSVLS